MNPILNNPYPAWKKELNENGFILCQKSECHMGFLSLKGFEVHYKNCNGKKTDGEYVTCEICDVHFKTFLVKERHQARSHKIHEENNQNEAPINRFSSLFLEPERILPETAEELRDRILAESRKISHGRPPGRPPRSMPRPPIVLRTDPIDYQATSRLLVSSPSTSLSSQSSASGPLKSEDDQIRARERELAAEEAKLKEYQERVLRYERLAEEATKVALKDKELRLKKLAEDLKEREMQAKKKLQSAVESINVGKSEPFDQDQTLERILSFERGSTVDEVQSEADTEINAPTDIDPKESILPEPEDMHDNDEPIAEQAPKQPQVIATTSASSIDHQLVVNHNASLESLISRASRGEVTLVATKMDDGSYILVDNNQESVQAEQETITDEVVSPRSPEQSPKITDSNSPRKNESVPEIVTDEVVPEVQQQRSEEIVSKSPRKSEVTKQVALEVPKVQDEVPKGETISEEEGMDQDPNEVTEQNDQVEPVEQTPVASKRKRDEDVEVESEAKKSKSTPNEDEIFQPQITSTAVKKVQIRYEQPEAIISSPVRTRKKHSKSASKKKKEVDDDENQDVFDELVEQIEQMKDVKGRKAKVLPVPSSRRRTRQSLPEPEPEPPKNLAQAQPVEEPSKEAPKEPSKEPIEQPKLKKGRKTQEIQEQPEEKSDITEKLKVQETEQIETVSKATKGRKVKKVEEQPNLEKPEPDQAEPVVRKARKGRPSRKDQGQPESQEKESVNHPGVLKVQITRGGRSKRHEKEPLDEDKPLKSPIKTKNQGSSTIILGIGPEFTEKEIHKTLRQAFKKSKKPVQCFRCNDKDFSTFEGIKYHLRTCGKSQEELESEMIQCQYCNYRGLESNFNMHFRARHSRIILDQAKLKDESNEDIGEESLTATGRKRRSAASKATKRLSNVINDELDPLAVLEDDASDDDFAKQLATHQESDEEDDQDEGDAESSIASNQSEDDEDQDVISGPISEKREFRGRPQVYLNQVFDREILVAEKVFRSKNYFKNDFKDFEVVDWQAMDDLEFGTQSVQFKIGESKADTFGVFDTHKDGKDKYSFYAGGPIRASDWCPAQSNGLDVLALGVDDQFDEPTKSFVQLWTFGANHKPQFKLMLDIGQVRIHCLKWCPSLKNNSEDEDQDQRLGLLAVATSLGTVQVLALDKTLLLSAALADTTKYYRAVPTKVLKRQDQADHCLRLSWYRGVDHRVLAGAFMDGSIALWDLMTTSPLLKCDNEIYPKDLIKSHLRSEVVVVSLSENSEDSWPEYMMTGASDRNLHLWKLSGPQGPVIIKDVIANAVTDITWFSHYTGAYGVAFDDVHVQITNSYAYDVPSMESHTILAHNSTQLCMAYSPLNNVVLTSSSAGEIMMYVGYTERSLARIRNGKRKARTLIYKSTLQNNLNDLEYFPSYQGLVQEDQGLQVQCLDRDFKDVLDQSPEEVKMVKDRDCMSVEEVRKYPLLMINRINCSPNVGTKGWIFTGSQAGLGRLLMLPQLAKKP